MQHVQMKTHNFKPLPQDSASIFPVYMEVLLYHDAQPKNLGLVLLFSPLLPTSNV